MEPRNEEKQREVELQHEEKRPRFRIEKLEERIAPSHCAGGPHRNPFLTPGSGCGHPPGSGGGDV